MKKNQSNHLTMHIHNQGVQNENAGKFETFTAYPALKASIDKSINDEQALANSQESRKRNSTAAKNYAKNAAGEFIIDLSSKVSAYAVVSGNRTLLDKVNFVPSKVKKSSDIKHVQFMETLLTCAAEDLESFLEYGVTEDYLSDGANLLDNLKAEINNLSLSNSDLKQLTVQLEQQFKTTDAALSNVDAMVDTMRISDPVFHRLYWNSRRKRKTATSKLSVWGRVFDAATHTYLRKAKVSYRSSDGGKAADFGSELAKSVKFTGKAGGFQLKSLATGTYVFTATYAGYAEQEVTVYINAGVLARVEIPLTKLD